MKAKLILATVAIALVATVLVGVAAAQLQGIQTQATTAYQTNLRGINPETNQPYCTNNGTCTNTYCNETCAGYCWNSTDTCACQNQNGNCYGYGCAEQTQNQYQCGAGFMERNSFGRGCSR
ncbi:MAG: hypothetical protein NWE92_09865 [Candidatus Bathyarchaeota archaeon]|nr:hypothetical protein [Candidatus Bathyarchaeota archaeon]